MEAIDDVATLHKRELAQRDFQFSAYYENRAQIGNPAASIHYLKDGILKIEYRMPEKPNIIVSNITFYEDFAMKNTAGEMINYKIKDIGLLAT